MRRATVRTRHDDPATVAAAVRPDNTPEMATAVCDDAVVTTVERETTAGLRSTVDDYVVNLRVADRTTERGGRSAAGGGPAGPDDRADAREGPSDARDRPADGSDLGEQPEDRPNDDPNHE